MNKTKAKGCGCLLAVVAVLAIIGSIVGCSHGTNNSSQDTSQPSSAPAVSQPAPQASQPAPQPASQPPTQAGGNGLQAIHDPGQVTGSLSGPCQSSGQLPDSSCTPGSIDPAVTQANIAQTICRTGYTSTVRPPEADTEKFKLDKAYPAYGVPGGANTELDHLVPLELGGSNDASNLWPEASPNHKDAVEGALHDAVCSGQVSLADAQQAIASDWTTAEAKLGVGSSSTSTTAPAAPAPAPAGSGPVVHPGSFCSPPGATGVTSDGHPMVCSSKNGAQPRWRSAG